MHIPDGYLSPSTCAAFYGAMVPVWYLSSRKVERGRGRGRVAYISLAAAFTFVIMMFNIPLPGGSSGHMVGASLVAVLLGPWEAVLAMSVTITVQAFVFGDGGITALGANAFNLAFVMPLSGYLVYRLLVLRGTSARRKVWAAGAAGYISVVVGSLAAALELGLQPLIAQKGGVPLYAPYPFSVTIPAMTIPHLVFFGPVEALASSAVVSYMAREGDPEAAPFRRRVITPARVLILLVILSPIGLLAPGTPWGEWSRAEFLHILGFIPEGMKATFNWRGIIPGYGAGDSSFASALLYVFSAALGTMLAFLSIFIWSRFWRRD